MPNYCCVKNCSSYSNNKNCENLRFFCFPKDPKLSAIWVKACGNSKVNTSYARICALHFSEDDYCLKHKLLNQPLLKRKLDPNAKPNRNLPQSCGSDALTLSIALRADKRNNERIVSSCLENYEKRIQREKENISPQENIQQDVAVENSISTQTEVDMECSREFRIMELEKQLQLCQKEKKQLAEDNSKLRNLETSVESIFTDGQIKRLKNPTKKLNWTLDDISSAICLHSAGPRAYRYLYKKKHPLPGLSTLRHWASRMKIQPGILTDVLQYMKEYPLSQMERICVVSFDEMKIKSAYEYDKATDSILKPSEYVQVVMVRGLSGSWKQPIFYDYDCRMTASILKEIITTLHQVDFTVVAIVSDMGSTNQGLWRELDISTAKTYFENPVDRNQKIFVFADVPHLIKLFRNHFLDTGFIYKNQTINSEPLKELLQLTSCSEVSIMHKITEAHLNVKQAGRQKVKLATQLFSHTGSCAIKRAFSFGFLKSENSLICAYCMKVVNDWFDVFNSKVPKPDSRDRMMAYGLSLDTQNKILKEMTDLTSNILPPKRKAFLPFQRGILISNSSLPQLYNYLKEGHNMDFILTYRLNQDVLEHFFSVIRAKGGLHDHPTALEFKYRLRSYLLGRNETLLHTSHSSNVEEDDETNVLRLNFNEKENVITENLFKTLRTNDDETEEKTEPTVIYDEFEELEFEELQYDALQNLAGYIIKRLDLENAGEITSKQEKETSFTWVDAISEGGLRKPSPEFMKKIVALENIFNNINGNKIHVISEYLKFHLTNCDNINLPEKVKLLFFRCRLYFRIKSLNNNNNENKKQTYKKKIKTIT